MRASVLTLVRGREDRLRNLMTGLARQETPPDELVIASMQDVRPVGLPDPGCPVRIVDVPGEPMPLAAARNRSLEASTGDLAIFLDVDCIPSPTLVASYRDAATKQRGLFLGEVLYLPEGASTSPLDYATLDAVGTPHPSKPPIPSTGVRREPDEGELWGLSFALPRDAWLAVGGMDEAFAGYGGEETDFALRVAASGLPFYWTAGARAYHQHHRVHVPPLNHFDHILRNATLFRQRHGRWCMDYWLGQFADRGLIAWSRDAGRIERLRAPEPFEIAAALQPGHVRFS